MNKELVSEKLPARADKHTPAEQFMVSPPVAENLICEEVSTVRNGFGACSKAGCNCREFEGNASTCGNSGCGHAYSDHW